MQYTKTNLIDIYNDTKLYVKNYGHFFPIPKTILIHNISSKIDIINIYDKTNLLVMNIDCLDITVNMMKQKLFSHPVILNMASYSNPGGGVEFGSQAQEEDLFRRTNYFITLNNKTGFYPLKLNNIVYTSNVTVIKDSNYHLTEPQLQVNFIASSAIKNPILTPMGTLSIHDIKITKNKITQIIQTAYIHKHDAIILGAYGCGAYNNPPHIIASIFKECIKPYMHGAFKYIIFPILSYNDNPNYTIFKNILLL